MQAFSRGSLNDPFVYLALAAMKLVDHNKDGLPDILTVNVSLLAMNHCTETNQSGHHNS